MYFDFGEAMISLMPFTEITAPNFYQWLIALCSNHQHPVG
jgi:hypothetical protein